MMKFYKVSYNQFKKDVEDSGFDFNEEEIKSLYDNIKLPKRATKGSAGYDFFAPFNLEFKNKQSLRFPTGIRCEMDEDVVLLLFPRSGFGFKHRMALDNTCGVIDADYFGAANEGHINAKMHFENDRILGLNIKTGEAFMQGIFVKFVKTIDDESNEVRTGGFGSTTKKE